LNSDQSLPQEIIDDIVFLLRDIYPLAKDTFIRYEVGRGLLSKGALVTLRDCLDNIAMACNPNLEIVDQKKHLIKAQDFLERIIIEPAETYTEDRLRDLERRVRRDFRRAKFLLIKCPAKAEAECIVQETKKYVSRLRKDDKGHLKGQELLDMVEDLKNKIDPTIDKYAREVLSPLETKIFDRVFQVVLGIALILLSPILYWYITSVLRCLSQ
jgi:hypothetical protein